MCITPLHVETKTSRSQPVPCGRCPICTAKRASAWSFRLMQEDKKSETAHFVTLTYNTDHVPITKNGFLTLDKTDVQKFFKRLRKIQASKGHTERIKYYVAGEYGTENFRPHYHAIVFNCIDAVYYEMAWRKDERPIGEIHIGNVESASVGYTLKYISKPKRIPIHERDDRQKEFSLMSKALGKSYVTDNIRRWHHSDMDNRMYLTTNEGQKITMPRYYKNIIYTEEQRKRIAFLNRVAKLKHDLENPLTPIQEYQKVQAHLALFRKQQKKSNDGKI